MNAIMTIYNVFTIIIYFVLSFTCLYVGYKKGLRKGHKKGYTEGGSYVCNRIREIINGSEYKMLDESGLEMPDISNVPLIGSTVYSVLRPSLDIDAPAHIEPWTVYGSGITKSGEIYVLSFDKEIFLLDDEDEGLSFSTREKAENHLKKIESRCK